MAPRDPSDLAAELWSALDGFDDARAQAAFDELIAAFSFETIARTAVLPYLRVLGERWREADASVAQEHFATACCARLLSLARGWDRGIGPRVILACPPGEQHDIGLVVFGLALRDRGWRITFLGPNTPIPTLAAAAQQLTPDAVVLSALTRDSIAAVSTEIARLARKLTRPPRRRRRRHPARENGPEPTCSKADPSKRPPDLRRSNGAGFGKVFRSPSAACGEHASRAGGRADLPDPRVQVPPGRVRARDSGAHGAVGVDRVLRGAHVAEPNCVRAPCGRHVGSVALLRRGYLAHHPRDPRPEDVPRAGRRADRAVHPLAHDAGGGWSRSRAATWEAKRRVLRERAAELETQLSIRRREHVHDTLERPAPYLLALPASLPIGREPGAPGGGRRTHRGLPLRPHHHRQPRSPRATTRRDSRTHPLAASTARPPPGPAPPRPPRRTQPPPRARRPESGLAEPCSWTRAPPGLVNEAASPRAPVSCSTTSRRRPSQHHARSARRSTASAPFTRRRKWADRMP